MSVDRLKKTFKKISQKDSDFATFLKDDNSGDDLTLNNENDEDDDANDIDISDNENVNDDDDIDISYDEDDDDDDDEDASDSGNEGESDDVSQKKELVVASDDEYSDVLDTDSDSESALVSVMAPSATKTITIKMVDKWRNKLQMKCIESLRQLAVAFKAAINFAGDSKVDCELIVKGGTVYNAIISACLVDFVPALNAILSDSNNSQSNKNSKSNGQLAKNGTNLSNQFKENFVSSKNWKSVKISIKSYILDVLRLMDIIGKDELMIDLLKHLLDLCNYISVFPKFHKPTIKKCIELWSTSKDEPIRIVAFRCIFSLMTHLNVKITEFTLSKMYISFVRNSRFTSVNTLAEISYMKRSLVELLSTKPDVAYRSSFLNIRQMARLLHNALKIQKKEVKQSICNWQFVHPLCMYCILIGHLHDDEYIRSLAHPIVEIILGAIRLNEGGSYYPMRITLIRSLIQLIQQSNIYVPLAPFILQILEFPALSKNPKQSNMKILNMDCILKASKTELKEKAFCVGLVDGVFELSLSYLSSQSASIAFPELSLPFLIQLKKFVKECKMSVYTRKIKLLLSKIQENIRFVERIRKNQPINLADANSLNSVERKIKEEGPPITKFYDNWVKVSIKNKEILLNPKQKDMDDLPKIIRPLKKPKATEDDRKEFKGLFMDESEEEDDRKSSDQSDQERFEMKDEKDKRLKKGLSHKKSENTTKSKKRKVSSNEKAICLDDIKETKKNIKINILNRNSQDIDISDIDMPDMVEDFDISDI